MNNPNPPPIVRGAPKSAASQDFTIDFGQVVRIIRRGWWLPTILGFVGALVAAVLVLQVEPTFRANARLLMGNQTQNEGALGALLQDLALDDDRISGEIAIMHSARILRKVSERLDLAAVPDFNPALRPASGEPGPINRLSDGAVDLLKRVLGMSTDSVPGDPAEGQANAESGDPVADAALAGRRALGTQADFVGGLRGRLRISQVGNSHLVDIAFVSSDRRLAAAIPNAVAEVYVEDQLLRKFEALRSVTSSLNDRLGDMRARLEKTERAVIDYRNGIIEAGFGGQTRLDQQLADLAQRVGVASAEHSELRSQLETIDALIAREGAVAAAGVFESQIIDQTRVDLAQLDRRRTELLDRFGESARQVQDVIAEARRLEALIAAEVERQRNDLANRVELARVRAETLRAKLEELEQLSIEKSEREVRLIQLEREQAAALTTYESFLDKFTETSEATDLQQRDAQIVDYADPPAAPIAPNKKLSVALGGIAGGALGLGLVFFRSFADRRVRSLHGLRAAIGGVQLFALPRVRSGLRRADPLAGNQRRRVVPLAEVVRTLRSVLVLSSASSERMVVTLVSPGAGAGKTTTSIMLARSITQMGMSCVIVDADLQAGNVASRIGLAPKHSMLTILKEQVTLDDALLTDPGSDVRVLSCLPGLQDPAGVLLSRRMRDLIEELAGSFDVVIVDTAPLLAGSDAIPMAKVADRVILLARYGTPAEDIENSLETLSGVGVGVRCGVLTMVPPKELVDHRSYGYGYT